MDDFFTPASFVTLTGAVASVVVIVNAIRHAVNWGPRWFGLILSIGIAFLAWHISAGTGDQSKTTALGGLGYFIVLVNGCLIYTSSFGIQNTVIGKPPNGDGGGLDWQGVTKGTEREKPARLTARSYW